MAFTKGHKINIGRKFFKELYPNKGMSGKTHSEETKLKMSLASKGKPKSEEHRKKLSLAKIGKVGNRLGTYQTLDSRKKMSISHIGLLSGSKHPMWRGGISNNSYSVDWRNSLKISIRERDHYQCQLCGKNQGDKAHSVHHIDYNKKNCNPNNLITLCSSCHSKTNRNREKWIEYFKNNII